MKKIILLASVITVASFASCKKAATCECTITETKTVNGTAQTQANTTTTRTNTREIAKTGKKTAEAMCGNYEDIKTDVYSNAGFTQTTVTKTNGACAIK
jgi:hypothetical protein